MDLLSGIASVVAVVQLAQSVCSILKVYYYGVRDARKDIDRMFTAIQSLERILAHAEKIVKSYHANNIEIFLADPSCPIQQLKDELDKIRLQLETPSLKGRLGSLVQSLQWPFKNREVEKTIRIMEQYKSTLSISLGFEVL